MSEPIKQCGTCRWWKPFVNPDTGRKCPAQPGECSWPLPFQWPEKWPAAIRRKQSAALHFNDTPREPGRICVSDFHGGDCETWEPKEQPKVQVDEGPKLL